MRRIDKLDCFYAIKTLMSHGLFYGPRKNRVSIEFMKEAVYFLNSEKNKFTASTAIDIWNKTKHDALPAVKVITRRRIYRVRELAKKFTMNDFREAIEKVNNNKWAIGQSGNKKYKHWRFNFDYLIKKGTLVRILEGWLDTPEVVDEIDKRNEMRNS